MSTEIDHLSTKQLYDLYGEPGLEPVKRIDGQPLPPGIPEHGIPPVWFGNKSEKITLPESRILLSDFGVAFSHKLTAISLVSTLLHLAHYQLSGRRSGRSGDPIETDAPSL
ncbi:hypothetical protein BDW59DRAFT_14279 [Aspergillus cavernicola]|uniref:Uncharacterized protein n=1 Tax=Aspergillus cavernicola TaxID=176166 RepID=A0ABR4ISZ5_9EURO